MKKFINQAETLVHEALQGMALVHADLLTVHYAPDFIMRADAPTDGKVALLSGGGSGHEPMHGGFVGLGMLDAACPGAVFTSPTPDQIYAATQAVHGGAGILYIVKNYTGDVLNFEMAADLAREENIPVEMVIINDDVAVEDSLHTAGRRGVGVTVIAEKLAGAAAEQGQDLAAVAELVRRVNTRGRSMGMALSSCTVPHVGKPTFDLPEGQVELGIGIHGEPGRKRLAMAPAQDLAAMLFQPVVDDLGVDAGDEVLVFVNGLGATPLLELYLLYHEIAKLCQQQGVRIVRSLVGSYMTSLDMAGATLSMVVMDDAMVKLWDAPVRTPALRWGL